MDCSDNCLLCNNQKKYFVNFSAYHGVCDNHKVLGRFTCVHCDSVVVVMEFYFDSEEATQGFERSYLIPEVSKGGGKYSENFENNESQKYIKSQDISSAPNKEETYLNQYNNLKKEKNTESSNGKSDEKHLYSLIDQVMEPQILIGSQNNEQDTEIKKHKPADIEKPKITSPSAYSLSQPIINNDIEKTEVLHKGDSNYMYLNEEQTPKKDNFYDNIEPNFPENKAQNSENQIYRIRKPSFCRITCICFVVIILSIIGSLIYLFITDK